MQHDCTAVIQKGERFWIGWIEGLQGVNSQAESREKLIINLESALSEMLALSSGAEDGT